MRASVICTGTLVHRWLLDRCVLADNGWVSTNGEPTSYNPKVNQAAGMVTVQINCRIEQAVALMTQRARERNVTVEEIAGGVLDRSIRFG